MRTKQSKKFIRKKFNITKEEFENYVMAPLSPIDDFNHYES